MLRRFFALALTVSVVTLAAGRHGLLAQEGQAPPPDDVTAQEQDAAKADAGQDQPPAAQTQPPTEVPGEAVRAEYQAQLGLWKDSLKELRRIQNQYHTTPPNELEQVQKQWDEQMAKTELLIPAVRAAAIKFYLAFPNTDRETTQFLVKLLADEVATDRFEEAAQLSRVLVDGQCDVAQVYRDAGIAHFAIQDFDRAGEYLQRAAETNALAPPSNPEDKLAVRLAQLAIGMHSDVEKYKQFWAAEQEILKKEAEADDLPRVKFTTSKGEIVFELFENEAPDTVGNFISLVSNGFYDGLSFHRVLPGFMAQGGCPNGDGSGGPGYSIYDEFDKPNHRKHFRGYLSMAKTPAANSGGSQFFITFLPTGYLNGQHTAFGRVIEGMDVVLSLQRRSPEAENAPAADTIIKAEVVRKRDHEYLPNKVE